MALAKGEGKRNNDRGATTVEARGDGGATTIEPYNGVIERGVSKVFMDLKGRKYTL